MEKKYRTGRMGQMEKINGWIKKIMYRERFIYLGRTAAIVLVAGLIGLYLNRAGVMKENILMVLLIGVIMTGAFTAGYEYGVIGAVASVLIFNYFFTVPVHTFAIMNPDDVALMIFFLIISFISSAMTARFRRQVEIAEENERTARLLGLPPYVPLLSAKAAKGELLRLCPGYSG